MGPRPVRIETATLRGLDLLVEYFSDGNVIGHCWAYDEVSGRTCRLVAEGMGWVELQLDWDDVVESLLEHFRRENGGAEPRLASLGWGKAPPAKILVA